MSKIFSVENPFKKEGKGVWLLKEEKEGKKVLATILFGQGNLRIDMQDEKDIRITKKGKGKSTTISIDF